VINKPSTVDSQSYYAGVMLDAFVHQFIIGEALSVHIQTLIVNYLSAFIAADNKGSRNVVIHLLSHMYAFYILTQKSFKFLDLSLLENVCLRAYIPGLLLTQLTINNK